MKLLSSNVVASAKIKTLGYVVISFSGMYSAITQDFKTGGTFLALGGLIIAMGDLL